MEPKQKLLQSIAGYLLSFLVLVALYFLATEAFGLDSLVSGDATGTAGPITENLSRFGFILVAIGGTLLAFVVVNNYLVVLLTGAPVGTGFFLFYLIVVAGFYVLATKAFGFDPYLKQQTIRETSKPIDEEWRNYGLGAVAAIGGLTIMVMVFNAIVGNTIGVLAGANYSYKAPRMNSSDLGVMAMRTGKFNREKHDYSRDAYRLREQEALARRAREINEWNEYQRKLKAYEENQRRQQQQQIQYIPIVIPPPSQQQRAST